MAVSIRKRSGSGSGSTLPTAKTKSPLPREKVVKMYDVILKGENPTTSTFGETFWSEFFLLKPKVNHLETELTKMNHEQVTIAVSILVPITTNSNTINEFYIDLQCKIFLLF